MAKRNSKYNQVSSEFEILRIVIRHLWELNDAGMKELAQSAKVSKGTIENWKYGYTHSPRIDTLSKVLFSLGYDIKATKRKKPNLRTVK